MKVSFESCVVDFDTREVFRAGTPVALSPKAFALLELLIVRRPKAVSRAEIHQALWPDTFVTETNLANLVLELRSSLGDDAHTPRILRTLPRFGYAFCAETRVEERDQEREAPAESLSHRLIWARREIRLFPGENVIGRDRSSAVWINDESVSRRHARIVIDEAGASLEDLGSKNGTYLHGSVVTRPTRLQDGDEITVGQVVTPLRFHSFSESSTTRTGKGRSPERT
jgi:DNA-binding winged helix-turn-helix (wHTH) protein